MSLSQNHWPELPYEAWKDTCQTLHRWIQIIGKIRLSKSPWLNHSWHSTLYLTEVGLTTGLIHDGDHSYSIGLDFLSHSLRIRKSSGKVISLPLRQESVSSFHSRCLDALLSEGIECRIDNRPNEVMDATPFPEDLIHQTYDPEYAQRFWRVLLRIHPLMQGFRSRFIGKCSPVHLFWGSLDLAVTRFSGRRAPEHPGGVPHLSDLVAREAYSHEVSSCGFWPGSELYPRAAFYSYAYPAPSGFESARVPEGAFYDQKLREFILPYDVVQKSISPEKLILDFFQSTYEAAADLAKWDRALLEQSPYLDAVRSRYERKGHRLEDLEHPSSGAA